MYQQFFYLVTGISEIIAGIAVIIFAVLLLIKQSPRRRRGKRGYGYYAIYEQIRKDNIILLEHMVEIYTTLSNTLDPDKDTMSIKTIGTRIETLQEQISESKD